MKSACVKNESLYDVVQLGREGVHVWFDSANRNLNLARDLAGAPRGEVDAEILNGLERLCLLPTRGEQAEVLSLLPEERYVKVLSTYVSLLFGEEGQSVH